MAFFGGIPGFGGGMFPANQSPFGGPIDFGMEGINQALAQNAAVQPKPKGKGFGEFLRAFAGNLGDSLTGNPVYSQQQQMMAEQQRMAEMYERQRQDEIADYEAKKQIDQRYSSPDLPGLADEFNWYSQQPPEMQQAVTDYMKVRYPGNFVPPAPVTLPYGATVQGGDGGNLDSVPTTEDGYTYTPGPGGRANQHNWKRIGGPGPGGSGGFR